MKVSITKNDVVVQVEERVIDVVSIAPQLTATVSNQDVLVDVVSNVPADVFVGIAALGTATSSPAWKIKRISIPLNGNMSIIWANGNINQINIWDDRAALSYSALP